MRGTRYSVSTLLLLMTIVAIGISSILTARYIAAMRREHQKVLDQTGYIDVPDPTKVYVRELLCPAPETWQFQVYTPPGHQLMQGIGTDLLDDEDYPSRLRDESFFRQTGQTTFTISLYQNQEGIWRLAKYYPRNGSDLRLEDDFSWVLEKKNRIHAGSGGQPIHGPVREYEVGDRIPLWILRDDEGNHPGSLIVWLEADLQAKFRSRDGNPSRCP